MFMNPEKILLPGEAICFHTQKSPIIFTMPVVWTALTLFFFAQTHQFISGMPGLPLINSIANLAWVPGVMAVFSWLNQGLIYLTSDFIVTNQRVILREGFFSRHSTETRLAAIAEIKVDQSLVGQFLNFGSITVNSFGGNAEVFAAILSPYTFQRKVSEISLNSKTYS
ncbi:MAG TPA: PH domain-containing protein [Gammaproteobacteria bacterium]|nr:PH domain-containing protein [Gammaproteobacteria bacterium]